MKLTKNLSGTIVDLIIVKNHGRQFFLKKLKLKPTTDINPCLIILNLCRYKFNINKFTTDGTHLLSSSQIDRLKMF